jgi:rod shape-determining protein MreD
MTNLSNRLRDTLPMLAILGALLFMLLPLRPFDTAGIAPPVTLMAVVFWSLFVPSALPLWLVAAVGLVEDLLTGGPLGLTALLLLLAGVLIDTLRRDLVELSFPLLWLGFGAVSAGYLTLEWIGFSLTAGTALDFAPSAARWALGVAFFPLMLRFVLMPLHRLVVAGR